MFVLHLYGAFQRSLGREPPLHDPASGRKGQAERRHVVVAWVANEVGFFKIVEADIEIILRHAGIFAVPAAAFNMEAGCAQISEGGLLIVRRAAFAMMAGDGERVFKAEPEQIFARSILHLDIGCEVEFAVLDLVSHDFARCGEGY